MPGDREKLQQDEEEEEGGLCSPARRPRTLLWALLACLGTLAIVGAGRDTSHRVASHGVMSRSRHHLRHRVRLPAVLQRPAVSAEPRPRG